jgi:NADPH:quinone reductase-like Zn-dependent oxidoreductase
MKAIVCRRFGPPDQLLFTDVPEPTLTDDSVVVRMRASSVNAVDWRVMRGRPYIGRLMGIGVRRPSTTVPGVDVAGVVESVGPSVTQFKPGDEVFGTCNRAWAEYVVGGERNFVLKPTRLTFEGAAAVPAAGQTALDALRRGAQLRAGQTVLINGASGGVGTFAVQIATAIGAEVTGVCSTGNIEMVRSIGAAHVVDYTREDFVRSGRRYDVLLDVAGNRSISDCLRVLNPTGTLVIVGGPETPLLGPLSHWLAAIARRRFVSQRLVPFLSKGSSEGLSSLKELIDDERISPIIDRTYPLRDAGAAVGYVETRHARAKVVITI